VHVLGEQGVLLESDFRTTVPTFGVNGYATAFIDQGELNGMAIDSNNRIVLAGRANGKIALARLTANLSSVPSRCWELFRKARIVISC